MTWETLAGGELPRGTCLDDETTMRLIHVAIADKLLEKIDEIIIEDRYHSRYTLFHEMIHQFITQREAELQARARARDGDREMDRGGDVDATSNGDGPVEGITPSPGAP